MVLTADRRTERWTVGQIDSQTDSTYKQTDTIENQSDRQTGIQTDTTDKQTVRRGQADKQAGRHEDLMTLRPDRPLYLNLTRKKNKINKACVKIVTIHFLLCLKNVMLQNMGFMSHTSRYPRLNVQMTLQYPSNAFCFSSSQ